MDCHLQIDADLDPAYHFVPDPDPTFHVDADPDPSFPCNLMRFNPETDQQHLF
jgi:hypothetical protein